MTLKEWLDRKFLDYEANQNRRATQRDFAAWLGVKEGALGHWMSGMRTPDKKSAGILAAKLGPEVYDILGLARPVDDPELSFVNLNWERVPPTVRKTIIASIERAVGDERPAKVKRAVAAPKPGTS